MRNALMLLMIALYVQLLWWTYSTGQDAMFAALAGGVLLGELASLLRVGKTMSAVFVEKLTQSPQRIYLSVAIMVLANLFGLHLLGLF